MDINTLLDSLDQLFGWELPEGTLIEAVQSQVGRLNSDDLGAFYLD